MTLNQGLSYRRVSVLLFLASVVGISFALYLQYVDHLDPCPLCIFQRIGLTGIVQVIDGRTGDHRVIFPFFLLHLFSGGFFRNSGCG